MGYMSKKLSLLILAYTIFVTIILYWVENIYHPSYGIQMIQKIVSFFVLPMGIAYWLRVDIGSAWYLSRQGIWYGVGFGLFSMILIALTAWILRGSIDWDAIHASMEARHITKSTFLLVFLYIMFGNSLIEEYFFRWIVQRQMAFHSRPGSYMLSASMFSLYHVTIFGTWFSGWILCLALFWLFSGGLFFSWLYEKTGGIWSAWVFHILADSMILLIGYQVFFS